MNDKFALFLDFDDVVIHRMNKLSPSNSFHKTADSFVFDKSAVEAVYKILHFVEGCGFKPVIVLSTSWIKYVTPQMLFLVLSRHFPARYIDRWLTFACQPTVQTRYQRINIWLKEHGEFDLVSPTSYFILDDPNSGTGLQDFRSALLSDPLHNNSMDQHTLLMPPPNIMDIFHANLAIKQITLINNITPHKLIQTGNIK